MAIPSDGPFRATHEDRRAMLSNHMLAAIEPLLVGTPYAELSVERIIKSAKIGRTTFYAYFRDKNDLLLAMAKGVVTDLGDIAFWRLPDSASKADLYRALKGITEAYREHRLLFRAIVESPRPDVAGVRAIYDSVVTTGVANVTKHIVDGQSHGTIAPELAPEGTATLLVFMAERALYEVVGRGSDQPDDSFLVSLTDVFWRTLYAGYRPSAPDEHSERGEVTLH